MNLSDLFFIQSAHHAACSEARIFPVYYRMNLRSLFISALALVPALAVAHPGHGDNALHLHLGLPSSSNALDLRLTFAALVLGLVYHAVRAFKRR